MAKKQKGVIFIDKNRLDIFAEAMSNILQLPLAPDTVNNLDIISKDKLRTTIQAFISTNKLPPAIFVILLSDAILFVKNFSDQPAVSGNNPQPASGQQLTPQVAPQPQSKIPPLELAKMNEEKEQQRKLEIQSFLDKIPFENISTKETHLPTGVQVIAANSDYIEAIKNILEEQGSLVEAVVPASLLGKETTQLTALSTEIARLVLTKDVIIKQNSMIKRVEIPVSSPTDAPTLFQKNKKNLRLFAMLGIFAILLITLGVVYITSNSETKKLKERKAIPSIAQAVPIVAPSLSPTIALQSVGGSVSAAADAIAANTRISIVYSDATKTIATTLQSALQQRGYINVVLNLSNISSSRTTVIFAAAISLQDREVILTEVKNVSSNLTTLTNAQPQYDIVITIGR